MPDIPKSTEPDKNKPPVKPERNRNIAGFSFVTGVISIMTCCAAILLDLASGDYGGVRPVVFIMLGLPAGLFGMLAGFAWQKIRKGARLGFGDLILLAVIGFVAGMLPLILIQSLPQ